MNTYQTHGLRHDTDALFARLLPESPIAPRWLLTPCAVIHENTITLVRSAADLLALPDDAQVLCPWPGQQRQDVFEFTVGAFRSAVAGRDHSGGEQQMEPDSVPKVEATESEAVQMAQSLVAYMEVLKKRRSSRQLSCAFTHAEEALMWLQRIAPTVAEEAAP